MVFLAVHCVAEQQAVYTINGSEHVLCRQKPLTIHHLSIHCPSITPPDMISQVTLQVGLKSFLTVSEMYLTDGYRRHSIIWDYFKIISQYIFWKPCYLLIPFLFHFSGSLKSVYFFCIHSRVVPLISLNVYYPTSQFCCTPLSPILSHHAQSNADKLAIYHSYPQYHKTVTVQCHITPSPPLLSLSVFHYSVPYSP
jgi:hypothetical protein